MSFIQPHIEALPSSNNVDACIHNIKVALCLEIRRINPQGYILYRYNMCRRACIFSVQLLGFSIECAFIWQIFDSAYFAHQRKILLLYLDIFSYAARQNFWCIETTCNIQLLCVCISNVYKNMLRCIHFWWDGDVFDALVVMCVIDFQVTNNASNQASRRCYVLQNI